MVLYKIYKNSLSDWQRGKIRRHVFLMLRRLNLYHFLNTLNLTICRNYFEVSLNNLGEITSRLSISASVEVTQNDLRSSQSLPEDSLDDLNLSHFVCENILLDIRQKGFSLRKNHLLDSNLNVIGGYRIPFIKLPIYNQALPTPIVYKGIIAYLSDPTYLNYYHWMCGTLPFLATYKKYMPLDHIDYFYIGEEGVSKFHLESLARAGISPDQILLNACTSDRILAGITNRFIGLNDPISYNSYIFTRELFSDFLKCTSQKPERRIYVKRGKVARRQVVNEKLVLEFLGKNNFEIVQMDGKSIEEQARIFSSAEIIIAPHGAALTNLLFVSSETSIIEIMPYGYINNCFAVLASHAGAKHFYLQGRPTKASNSDSHSFDIEVDIHKLSLLCCKIGLELV